MATLLQQAERLEKLSQKVIVEQLFIALKKAENFVLQANKIQLERNQDSLGNLFSKYKESTQDYWRYVDQPKDPSYKVTSNRYNFEWSGEFLLGLNMTINDDEAIISSSGMDGKKEAFIISRKALGINDDNLKIIIKNELLPYLHKYARDILHL